MSGKRPLASSGAAAPERRTRARAADPLRQNDGDDGLLGHAARGRSAGATSDGAVDLQVGENGKEAPAAVDGDASDDDAVHEHQVGDNPSEGAMRLRSQPSRHLQRATLLFTLSARPPHHTHHIPPLCIN